jgi:hypothetical protein
MAVAGNAFWGLALIVGIVLQLVMIYALTKRFNKVAYQ